MNIVIFNSEKEGSIVLTLDGEGRPVLRIRGVPNVRDGDYGPSELLGDPKYPMHAASLVYTWALELCRSDSGIAAAQEYLRQWPDGPQADPSDIELGHAQHEELMKAAEDLNVDTPTLDQMAPEQLRDQIHLMVDRLTDEEAEGATAYLLRMRISLATTLLYGFYLRASQEKS